MTYADLTKDLDPEFVLKPEIEVIEEYPKDYLIQKEKELFGLYLSNHPVTNYKAKYKDIISLNQIKDFFNKRINTIIMVDKIKTIKTRSGTDMMFITGSDEYQSLDFTVFPRVYNRYMDLNIQNGMILKITGIVEKRYNDFQVVVDVIESLNKN